MAAMSYLLAQFASCLNPEFMLLVYSVAMVLPWHWFQM